MTRHLRRPMASKQQGQTLIIAILILGVLLGLGLVFASLIFRNVSQAQTAGRRSVASDLAEAGIRYAHYQLLNSELGADWTPTPPNLVGPLTKDPDALYLRPGTGFGLRSDADPVLDKGGPDGLGPYTRVDFDRGRALIRVRYAPDNFNLVGTQAGNLRKPGRAKSYLMIEAIGRAGRLNANDPSLLSTQAVRISGFANSAAFRGELGRIRGIDAQQVNSRKIMAVASIGIIESGRFITNKFKVTRPAEIGALSDPAAVPSGNPGGANLGNLGVQYEGFPVRPPLEMGGTLATNAGTVQGSGSLWSNADLVVHGQVSTTLNLDIGDTWTIAGELRGANNAAEVRVRRFFWDTAANAYSDVFGARPTLTQPWLLTDRDGGTGPGGVDGDAPLSSRDSNFSTVGGVVRDGFLDADRQGFARSAARKEPPSMQTVDPATSLNRYLTMTRDSGNQVFGRNIGRSGYGRGIYVDSSERGNLATEDEREVADAIRSLPSDWLNPNNPNSLGWQGPFYRPVAPHVELVPDGFIITRDTRSNNRYWRQLNNQSSNNSVCRFVLRTINVPGRGPVTYVLNTITSPIFQSTAFPSDADFQNQGVEFNGVLYFEGDVSVRGVIPTNKQVTLVSNGSIYIQGSITKGVVTTGDFGQARGQLLSTPSRSSLMMMAKDYVVLNTTMFFGPKPGSVARAKNASPLPDTPNPVELDLSDSQSLVLNAQFLLNPASGTPANPSTWVPFATSYTTFGAGTTVTPSLLMTHAADSDDGNPSFINLQVRPRTFESANNGVATFASFGRSLDFLLSDAAIDYPDYNVASPYYTTPGDLPVYGLGNPSTNRLPRYETLGNLLWATQTYGNREITGLNPNGLSTLFAVQDETELQVNLTSVGNVAPKNYALARSAITPFDIRIEAAMFAEEGSFFVIPGAWFNYKTDDTRSRFDAQVASFQGAGASLADALMLAQRERFQTFGSMVETPFYNEPLNVRVTILGAVSENMPAPIAQQAEWLKKWGWMPRFRGGSRNFIPAQHVPAGYDLNTDLAVPNLAIIYDPALATGTSDGVTPIRTKPFGPNPNDFWVLPPMPRLPVSPTLMYFGETNP